MAATRERTNRIKIEKFRFTVPVSQSIEVYQGDQVCWDETNHCAVPMVATSGSQFLGIADSSSQIESPGSTTFLSAAKYPNINVVQKGLVEQIVDAADDQVRYHAFDALMGVPATNAQTVKKGSSPKVGFVDPKWASASGRVVSTGDLVRLWLVVPSAYRATD